MSEFFIVDVRPQWQHNPYITLWRPDNAGYAYPLPWAGRYSRETIDAWPSYYHKLRYGSKRALERFPVPLAVVQALGHAPAPRMVDGDVGPVIPNTAVNRAALRKARYVPATWRTPVPVGTGREG